MINFESLNDGCPLIIQSSVQLYAMKVSSWIVKVTAKIEIIMEQT